MYTAIVKINTTPTTTSNASPCKNACQNFGKGFTEGFRKGALTGFVAGGVLWTPGVKVTEDGEAVSNQTKGIIHAILTAGIGVLSGLVNGVSSAFSGCLKKQHSN